MMKCQTIVAAVTFALLGWVLLLSPVTAVAVEATDPVRVAVFDFELIDTSLQGEMRGADEDETARLAMLGAQLRQSLAEAPNVVLVDIEPVRSAARDRKLHTCRDCARKLAAEIGADLAMTGTVQKVSNLILNINFYVQDVATGRMLQAASADIRGNTDQSWRRGLQWLIKNRLRSFAAAEPAPPQQD